MCPNKVHDFLNICLSYLVCKDIDENELSQKLNDNISLGDKTFSFINGLHQVEQELKKDLAFFVQSDPAVDSEEEIVLAYPGYKCITYYRIAHLLYGLGFKLEARIISEEAHTLTGIDIHPGAQIAVPFFIDHGTGIVIGETAVVAKNVKLYQGVTLGALSLAKGHEMKGVKRHPTIDENVTIYAGASILGDVHVGKNVTIGSNVYITEDVPDNVKVAIAKPSLVVIKKSE